MKIVFILICFISALNGFAQGSYAPAAGQVGSTAMHKDSVDFIAWASQVEITRGYLDIADPGLGYADFGLPADGQGAPDPSIVSLGDNGQAIIQFDGFIYDGVGNDFAIFENSFSDEFLELAFVEVSSDGTNYTRFPAHSETQQSIQVDGFGTVDPTMLNNFAGKYRAQYGVPFDLNELAGTVGLDVNAITHIRIVDCVGSISPAYGSFDSQGNMVNDPYPTPFPSGGFDLDAVGAIHFTPTVGIEEAQFLQVRAFPNPTQGLFRVDGIGIERIIIQAIDGKVMLESTSDVIDLSKYPSGIYFAQIYSASNSRTLQIVKE